MKTADAIAHFGGRKINLAKALGLHKSAISQWGENVPELRAYQIKEIMDNDAKRNDGNPE